MRLVRHVVGVFLLLVIVFAVGCAQKMQCAPPNVMVGDTCCIDADGNSLCDTWDEEDEVEPEIVYTEPLVEQVVDEPDLYQEFAETFASTWNRKSYTALHGLFVDDINKRFSSNEFNFLARKIDAKEGITSVSLNGVVGDTAEYEIMAGGKKKLVSADIDEKDGVLKHEAFYFFEDLSADAACGDDSACFVSFATITGDRNYCDKAGDLRVDCVAKFGVSNTLTQKIDNCIEITEYYGRAECLTQLAVKENNIEPCWDAGQDKQIFECMGEVAAVDEDVDRCADFISSRGYPGTRLQHTYCILGYVRETNDTDACAKIDRRDDVMLGAMQEGCYKYSFP